MKKLTTVILLGLLGSSLTAQELKVKNVPAVVKTSFDKAYPGANAKWELEEGRYEASFIDRGVNTSVLLDSGGLLFATEVDIPQDQAPEKAISYVKQHRGGKTIKETTKITKADGTVNYEIEVGGDDLIFDAMGNFLNTSNEEKMGKEQGDKD